jgi:hypothetical protein
LSQYTGAEKRAIIERAEALLAEPGATQRTVADQLPIAQSTLCDWLREAGVENSGHTGGPAPAGIVANDQDASITSKPLSDPRGVTPDQLLEKHGLDPEDWIVTSIRVSEWGKQDDPMFQLRVNATRRDGLLVIPDLGDFEPWSYGTQPEDYAGRVVALIPDLHAPFHDESALAAVCDLLDYERPDQVIFLGDVADFSMLSKHRTHRRFGALVNETNNVVVTNFRRVREAVPDAQIVLLPGNHDDRLLYAVQDAIPELSHTTPGRLPGDPDVLPDALGFRTLWRLDELGIELVDEDWKLAQYGITPELTARHGYLTGNNSERKLLEKHGRSQVHGHDHRGSLIYRTKHDPLDIRVAMSCGTLSEVKPDGLGYEPDPDWTPGMGWCQVWDGGLFQLSFLPYVKNKLLTPWGAAYEGKE